MADGTQEPDFLLLMHDVARLVRLEVDRRARLNGMNRAQWGMLIKLARHPGLSQKDLAEILEVEPMTVARLTDRLAARRLVERRADPRDRRIWRLHLTEAANPLLGHIETQRAEVAAMIARALPGDMAATMLDGLLRVKATLQAAGCRASTENPPPEPALDPADDAASAEQEMV